tara:strand:+ start:323 stop:1042 length:720 start_codon:yes stop_codon:yes gene_type:complete
MQGKIVSYDHKNNSGCLEASNGEKYIFSGYSWSEKKLPVPKDEVGFTFSRTGSIDKIFYRNKTIYNQELTNAAATPELLGSNINSSTSLINIERLKSTEYEKYQIENRYGFIRWVLKALKNFADFSGRARRKEYWCFYLASTVFIITCRIILTIISLDYINYDAALSIISFIGFVNIILIIPTVAVGTRRLHDVGQSGWWQLLWFIPVIGWIVILFLLCKNTSPHNNQWGQPAKVTRLL